MEPRTVAIGTSVGTWPPTTRIALAAIAALAFALTTLVVGMASGAPPQFLILDTTMGLTFIVAGVVAWLRRPEVLTGPLLVLCSALNFVGSYAPTGRPVVSHLGFSFEGYYDVALAVLVLALPGRWPQGRYRAVAVALAVAFLVRSGARLFVLDVEPNPFVLVRVPGLFESIEGASSVAIALLAGTVALTCVRRLITARPLARRVLWPILAAGFVAMVAATFAAAETTSFAATGQPLVDITEPWDEVFAWSVFAARLAVPIGFLVGSLRLRRAGGPLVALAVGLGHVPSPTRLESALGAALGDPDVRLLRRDPEGDGWLTARGDRAPAPQEDAEHAVTLLEHDGRPVAAIVHDPVLREDPALVGSVMAVLRLAIENERLDAALQARLEDVQASRARLVQAGVDERRRLERDLHDGAQQRLVSVSLALQQAREAAAAIGDAPDLQDRLTAAAVELRAAVGELRELARGLHPALLENEGLPAAVAALARRSPVPIEVTVDVPGRLPRSVEAAAYFIVAECLTNIARHADARSARVRVVEEEDEGRRLVVEIGDDGVGGADLARGTGLRGLADRVAALDGRFDVHRAPGGGTQVRAEIPIP